MGEPMTTKEILRQTCAHRIRYEHLPSGWRIWAHTDEEASDVALALCNLQPIKQGTSGWESLGSLGLVQHVYLLQFGRSLVRILSPAIPPRGQFSGLPLPAVTL